MYIFLFVQIYILVISGENEQNDETKVRHSTDLGDRMVGKIAVEVVDCEEQSSPTNSSTCSLFSNGKE